MIFAKEPRIISAVERGDKFTVVQGQDIGDHLAMCRDLRNHDPANGMSADRQFQHVASFPEIVLDILHSERPEVLHDANALRKWLATDEGKLFRTNRDAEPTKGTGLQVIVK